MSEEIFIYYKFKDRKTNQLIDAVLEFKDVEKKDPSLEKYFDIHDYRIVEKRLSRREEFDRWRKERKYLLKNKV